MKTQTGMNIITSQCCTTHVLCYFWHVLYVVWYVFGKCTVKDTHVHFDLYNIFSFSFSLYPLFLFLSHFLPKKTKLKCFCWCTVSDLASVQQKYHFSAKRNAFIQHTIVALQEEKKILFYVNFSQSEKEGAE